MAKRELNSRQKKFAELYLETGSAVKAAAEVYNVSSYSAAGVQGHRNMKNDAIKEYLAEHAEPVMKNMYRLALSADSEQVQFAASKDILDRAGYKPVEKQEVVVDTKIDVTPERLELAEKYEEELKKQL